MLVDCRHFGDVLVIRTAPDRRQAHISYFTDVLTPVYHSERRRIGARHKVALTETLKGTVRALFGKNCCRYLPAAVTEPLEGIVRALFEHNSCRSLTAAVTEPLEGTARALFGKNSSVKKALNRRQPQEDNKKAVTPHKVMSQPLANTIYLLAPPPDLPPGTTRPARLTAMPARPARA